MATAKGWFGKSFPWEVHRGPVCYLPSWRHQRHHWGWSAFLFLRFHGSYANLHYGYLPDALVDLTGGVVTNISLHSSSSDLMMMVKTAAEAGSLMTCSTLAGVSGSGILLHGFESFLTPECSATGPFS